MPWPCNWKLLPGSSVILMSGTTVCTSSGEAGAGAGGADTAALFAAGRLTSTSAPSLGALSSGSKIRAWSATRAPRSSSWASISWALRSPDTTRRWSALAVTLKDLALACSAIRSLLFALLAGSQSAVPLSCNCPPAAPPAPCSVSSAISRCWPLTCRRITPWLKSMPSTTERTAMSRAARLPVQSGLLRVPDRVASASSVPCMRQPTGATSDQTPTRGRLACSLACSGASSAQPQLTFRLCRRVLNSASA